MVRKSRLVDYIKIVVLIALMNFSTSVLACSCWHPEPEEYLASANLIFKGKVVAVKSSALKDTLGFNDMRAEFKVLKAYKGVILNKVTVTYGSNDGFCGWKFTIGEEVTVFAHGNSKKGFSINMCSIIPYASAVSHGDMRFQSAIEAYRDKRIALAKALQKNPTDEKLLSEQISFFIEHHDYEPAVAVFTQILARNPKNINAFLSRADILYKLELYEQAFADYQTTIRLDNNNLLAKHGKAISLLKLGKTNELGKEDKDFSGYDSSGSPKPSFKGLNLVGANFRDVKLYEVDFTNANLSHADFTGAYLLRVNFNNAVLDNADFSKAQLNSVSLKNTSLHKTKFNETQFNDTEISLWYRFVQC